MNVLFEPEQIDLLTKLVEASRNVPRDRRQKFMAFETVGSSQAEIIHPGFGNQKLLAYMGDIEILARQGLLALTHLSHGSVEFDVTPYGYKYYGTINRSAHQPVKKVEATIHEYLSGDTFQKKYPTAFERWQQTENLLWETDSQRQLTTIGHLCRESMQEFAMALVDKYKISKVDQNPSNTIARIKAVIEHVSKHLGTTEKSFLNALINYWGTVSDLVQRQEHGAQKEGEPLVWEDGRRVVFQTMMVMYELDRSLP